MKTLASCDPVEFLVQTNKIRNRAAEWLTLTKIIEIRKRMPDVGQDATKEERRAAEAAQMRANLKAALESAMGEHPRETAELLGMMCFIEPEDIRNHRAAELLGAFGELIGCPEVVDFFISLARLERINISGIAEA